MEHARQMKDRQELHAGRQAGAARGLPGRALGPALLAALAFLAPAAAAVSPLGPALATAPATAPAPALAPALDEGDDRASFIDGLYERGLYDMVVKEAEDFLRKHAGHPRSDVIRYRLACALFELDRKGDASDHFRVLSERHGFGFRAEAALRWGQCALEIDNLVQADAALKLVLEQDAQYLRLPATFLLAEVHFKRGEFAVAEPLYLEVIQADPDGDFGIDAASSLAWCSYRLGKHDRAVTVARSVMSRPIDSDLASEMQFLTGEALFETHNASQAVAAYRQVTEGPFADAALRGMGFARAEMKDDKGAADSFELLLTRYPDTRFAGEATLRLGVHRLMSGDAEAAWAALGSDAAPDDAETLYWKGRALAQLGRADEALEQLDAARRRDPDTELLRSIETVRGNLLADTGRGLEAAQAYETAGSAEALHAAAVSSFNAGDAARSLQLIEAALARGDRADDPATLLTKGEALFALGRYGEGAGAFAAVLAGTASQHHARAGTRLGWCLYLDGRVAEACAPFARVSQEHPDAPEAEEALYMTGRTLRESGKPELAVTAWAVYARKFPVAPRTAEVLLGLSEMDDRTARANLELLTRKHPDSPLVPRALLDLADRLSAAGELGAAEARYRELLERFPEHELVPNARYGLAWCLVEREQTEEAASLLAWFRSDEAARADATLTVSALELLAWAQSQGEDPEAAEISWLKFVEKSDDPAAVLNGARALSEAWKEVGDPERALNVYTFLSRRPDVRVPALVEAAWILIDAGRLDEAGARLAEAAAEAPRDAAVLEAGFFLAEAWFDAGDGAAAIPLYAAVAADPAHRLADEALYKQGFAHLRADEPAAALPCFDRLVREHMQSPLTVEAQFLAGESAFRLPDFEGTVARLKPLIEHAPKHEVASKARFRLGLALAQLERWSQAEVVLADLARTDPDFPTLSEAELWRARALAAQAKDRAAEAAFQRVVERDRGVLAARAQIGLGELERRAGRTETALSTFLKVAVLYAHEEEVAQALLLAGECLEELGDSAKAQDRYREIVQAHPQSSVAAEAARRLSGS